MEIHQPKQGQDVPEALKGGLHGRLAGHFCVLQSSVEALQRYLAANASPQVQADAEQILREMARRIAQADRISSSAVDLALGYRGALAQGLYPMELCGLLRDFCELARQELALRGRSDTIRFENQAGGPAMWVMGDEGLLDHILANLLSNSLLAGAPAHCRVVLQADGSLLYADDCGGMDPDKAQRLLCGAPRPEELAAGETGLLLVRSCAQALEWGVSPQPVPGGFGLRLMPRPAGEKAADRVEVSSPAAEQRRRAAAQRAAIRRELDATLG